VLRKPLELNGFPCYLLLDVPGCERTFLPRIHILDKLTERHSESATRTIRIFGVDLSQMHFKQKELDEWLRIR
jgi:hypothetical protein